MAERAFGRGDSPGWPVVCHHPGCGDEPMADPLGEEIAQAGWSSATDQASGNELMAEPSEEEIAQSTAAQKMDGACVSSTTNQAGGDDMSFTQEEEQESHP